MFPWILADGTTVTVTFQLNVENLVTWLIIGAISGFLAGLLVRGRRYSTLSSLIIGLVGALVGGLLYTALNLKASTPDVLLKGPQLRWIDFIISFVGALIVFLVVGVLYGFRKR